MRIAQLVPAEVGWKAVFTEPDGSESLSRILAWAVTSDDGEESELVGLIVDPASPSRIVNAADAVPPAGGAFSRYRFVAPEPIVVQAPPPPPPPPPDDDPTEQLAKGLLKRRR
ncbi:MAG TPA: hypothetical protein VNH40_03685 [Gaiellaceae bacterium]|nr:hypothetical protein [Gaiellaceae bacterium]